MAQLVSSRGAQKDVFCTPPDSGLCKRRHRNRIVRIAGVSAHVFLVLSSLQNADEHAVRAIHLKLLLSETNHSQSLEQANATFWDVITSIAVPS